ncbi:MAG: CdaR family protein [Peptoniphilaceae bacterium]
MKMKINKETMFKIISLIFAILLWSYVRSEVDPEKTIIFKDIDVRYENLSELKANDLAVINQKESKVNVTLKGKQSAVSKIKKDAISASVNLAGYYSGDYNVPIDVKVDGINVFIESKKPEFVNVKIEENISKNVDVEVKTKGKVKSSFVLGNVKKNEKVELKGPNTYIEQIDSINATVDVSGKSESIVLTAPVKAYDSEGKEVKGIKFNPSSVDVEIPILKTQTLPVKLNIVGEIPEGVDQNSFSIEPNSVSVKANSVVLNKVSEISTVPISVDTLLDGQSSIDVILPDGVSLVDNDIKFVASAFPIKVFEQEITFNKEDVGILNLDKELDFKFINKNKDIKVKISPKDPLSTEKLSKEDIDLNINLENLKEGKHKLDLDIKLSEKFKVNVIEPSSLEVELFKKRII